MSVFEILLHIHNLDIKFMDRIACVFPDISKKYHGKDILFSNIFKKLAVILHNLRNLSSANQAIRTIIEQHQLYFSQTDGSVGQIIAAVLEEKYSELLRAIRASTKNTEINSQIVLEIFNTLLLNQFSNISHATLISLYECEPIAEARKAVKDNLAAQRQRKLSR